MTSKFYPTPSDVKCYINGIEIDDMYRIDFKREVRHQPIYGYADKKWSFAAKGKELVTGQLVLNYRYPGYLTAVILKATIDEVTQNKANGSFVQNPVPPENFIDFTAIESLGAEERAAYIANELQNGRGTNQALIDELKKRFRERFINDDVIDRSSRVNKFTSPLSLDGHLTPFDISMRYGFQEQDTGYRRVFKSCVLIGESSVISSAAGAGNDMSSSAQPVFEVYPFFCKTIDTETYDGQNAKAEVDKLVESANKGPSFDSIRTFQ